MTNFLTRLRVDLHHKLMKIRIRQIFLVALMAISFHARASTQDEGLRTHVGRVDLGLQVGGDEIFWIPGDKNLIPAIAKNANVMLIGNNLKWAAPGVRTLRPAKEIFDFSDADALLQLAQTNGLKIRAHTLVWGDALPTWLTSQEWTREQLSEILRDHIKTVVGRYRGKIAVWDVVNEAFQWNGAYQENFWFRKLGPEYIEMAFRWAHEADPDALLFLNEDGTEGLGQGSDKFLELVQNLLSKGVPIHGIGLQTHVDLSYKTTGGNDVASPQALAENITRLGKLGVQVHISELDVRIPLPPTLESLQSQARVYADLYKACEGNSYCTGFFIWGVTDKWSWIPRAFPGEGAAMLLDENYAAKPAYTALLGAMRSTTEKCLGLIESTYPGLLRKPQPSAVLQDYYYRYYSESNNFVAVKGGKVFYWDPAAFPQPQEVFSLAQCLSFVPK